MDNLEEEQVRAESEVNQESKLSNYLTPFIPVKDYYVTPIIVIVNIAMFLFMVITGIDIFSPEPKDLVAWGANFRPETVNGQYWRLITRS